MAELAGMAAGRPLRREERSGHERRLGAELAEVRLHEGPEAARQARAVGAVAFTVGRHVVLGSSAATLGGGARDGLLAHELTHAAQQQPVWHRPLVGPVPVGAPGDAAEREADRFAATAGPRVGPPPRRLLHQARVQRFDLLKSFQGMFAGDDFDREVLVDYLASLNVNDRIEERGDSDNKARAITRQWARGEGGFVITARLMALMIREMQSGATLDDDEAAILELLERAENDHLAHVFGPGGVSAVDLLSDFHGEEEDRLVDLFSRRFEGGLEALRQGRVVPQGRAVPPGQPLGSAPPAAATASQDLAPDACSLLHPENCHSYEAWVGLFATLDTYDSPTGHTVIGSGPAPAATATDPAADPSQRRPPRRHEARPYDVNDRFIDGPTEQWVRDHLPPHLVEVAYQLPSDCADIAVILRHVWLVYHRRSETFRNWRIGSELDDPQAARIRGLLLNQVWTGSVERLARPYTGDDGRPLRSWAALESRLHVGDVLVWDHTDGGTGHTHTIAGIDRNEQDGRVRSLTLLQGNQPIGGARAAQLIPGAGAAAEAKRAQLRRAPGRRIERDTFGAADLRDRNGVWTWTDGTTVLVAAGPPVERETAGAQIHGLAAWTPVVAAVADVSDLLSRFEAALLDVRAQVEAGRDVGDAAAAEAFGRAAGARLWVLANEAARQPLRPSNTLLGADLGESSHFRPLQHLLSMAADLGGRSSSAATGPLFAVIGRALEPAARGLGSVSFEGRGDRPRRVLFTGFDPFGAGQPLRGQINPSGAAVLQLDGTEVAGPARERVAIEGVILPVSFDAFRAGMVESLLTQAGPLDAVITVSLNPGQDPAGPLQLEQFVVGVHQLRNGRIEVVPPAPASGPAGPALMEARGAEGVGAAAGLGPGLVEGRDVELHFTSTAEADRARGALGWPPGVPRQVTIDDVGALRTIVSTMERGVGDTGITFRAGGQGFGVQVVSGPGGSFLSNEVSYRVLRHLAASGSTTASFHVHTQRATTFTRGIIPEASATAAERQARADALAEARGVVSRLVASLRALARAVVRAR